jgi:hypothetical protein
VQIAALEQMKDVFTELKKMPLLFEQANSRLLMLITQALDFSTKVQTGAIDALTNLLDDNLFVQGRVGVVPIAQEFIVKS